MKQHLTAYDIANDVRLSRTLHKGTFLVLEGDTDARVYGRFICEKDCMVIPAHGKDNAIGALEILESDGFDGILTIVDADFWHLENIKPNSENLLLTDTHDLETMILKTSNLLERILSEFGKRERIRNLAGPVQTMVIEATLPIGLLRWLSSASRDNIPIKFRKLPFENFVDKTKLQTNVDELINEAKKNVRDAEVDEESLKIKIKSMKNEGYDPWQVCSGHDMVEILTIGLRFTFGNRKAKALTAEVVEGMLRMAYEYSHFCVTRLYKSIKNWENANPPFKILKR